VGATSTAAVDVVDPIHGGHNQLARNALGMPQVLFCIVTGSAPIAAMLFNDPWAVYGAGSSAPALFIIATAVLTIFSVGYVAMAQKVTAAGGFYSFVSHGFDQIVGLGAAFTIAGCYIFFSAGVTGVTAYFANATLLDWTGADIPVWVIEFGTLAAMVILAFFHIEVTAKVLGFFLVIELAALMVFGVAALFQPQDGLHLASLNPFGVGDSVANGAKAVFGAGTLGVGFFGAFWSWIGFEMAPNYAEESKDPKRIMGPVTYISVVGLGILYTFITWMLVVSWGAGNVSQAVADQFAGNYASVFYPQTDRLVGWDLGSASALTRAFQLTIVTGSYACQLAFFNTATRYLFSMGREGVLPAALGRTHRDHKSPYVASTVVGILCALIIGGFLMHDSSTLGAILKLGTWAPMMGNIGILALMGLVSLGIIRYFATVNDEPITGARWWTVVIAPLIAAAGLFFATYLLIANRETLGAAKGVFFVTYMWVGPILMFAAGAVVALIVKSRNPERFAGIGRYLHEDVPADA
jgi:amino acid transporter